MFDHIDDDEYDGQLGINDDEDPRILVSFDLTNSLPKRLYDLSANKSERKSPLTNTGSPVLGK